MFPLKRSLFILLILGLFSNGCWALARACSPNGMSSELSFSVDKDTMDIGYKQELASTYIIINLECTFTNTNSSQNYIYFRNMLDESTRMHMRNSGVELTQKLGSSYAAPVNITNGGVPDISLGTSSETYRKIFDWYDFKLLKGQNPLKPFQTGGFLLGTHVNSQGTAVGPVINLSLSGKMTVLCPSPRVTITANNGGAVNFGMVSPQLLQSGAVISKDFILGMKVAENCQTGLNISVRMTAGNNTINNSKYLVMDNGTQLLTKMNNSDMVYGESYYLGEILPTAPIDLPLTAELSKIPGQTIIPGAFSKTVNVTVSYQ